MSEQDEKAAQAAELHKAGASPKDIAYQYGWSLSTAYTMIAQGRHVVKATPKEVVEHRPRQALRLARTAAKNVDFQAMLDIANKTNRPLQDVLKDHGAI